MTVAPSQAALPPEARLFLDEEMERGECVPLAGGVALVYSARSPGKRAPSDTEGSPDPNEDAAVVVPLAAGCGILAVADGLGGEAAGEQAARLAVETLALAVAEIEDPVAQLRTAVIDGFERANQAVQALANGAATTLCVIEVSPGPEGKGCLVRPYHVGDSMIVVTSGRGRVKLQTVMHSPVGYAVEAGFLDEREALHHDERHIVSNVIGTPEMRIEIGPSLALAQLDTVVLASDGLADNLHTTEIIEYLRKGPLPRSALRLIADCRRRMTQPRTGEPSKPDDLTFVAFRPRRRKKK